MEIISEKDTIGHKGEIRIQFKARTDDILYLFWEDRYALCEGGERFERITELEKVINNMFAKVAMSKNLNGGYIGSSIYNRIVLFNRRINDFRTGRNIVSCSITEDCVHKLSALGRVLNTSTSNIFRLCIFDTLNPSDYQSDDTSKVFVSMLIEYQTIMIQVDGILKSLSEEDNEDIDVNIKTPEEVNFST